MAKLSSQDQSSFYATERSSARAAPKSHSHSGASLYAKIDRDGPRSSRLHNATNRRSERRTGEILPPVIPISEVRCAFLMGICDKLKKKKKQKVMFDIKKFREKKKAYDLCRTSKTELYRPTLHIFARQTDVVTAQVGLQCQASGSHIYFVDLCSRHHASRIQWDVCTKAPQKQAAPRIFRSDV